MSITAKMTLRNSHGNSLPGCQLASCPLDQVQDCHGTWQQMGQVWEQRLQDR